MNRLLCQARKDKTYQIKTSSVTIELIWLITALSFPCEKLL